MSCPTQGIKKPKTEPDKFRQRLTVREADEKNAENSIQGELKLGACQLLFNTLMMKPKIIYFIF